MHERLANLLGAASLAVTDLVLSGAPDLGVTELGRRVGLTQSAAARMVDGLQAAGLARRHRGGGRVVHVRLTARGEDAVREMLAARGAPLGDVLTVLDEDERETLTAILAKLLARLYERIGDSDVMCRLCDRRCCTDGAVCPVGQAERDAGGM